MKHIYGQPRPFCSRTGEQFVAADWRRTRRYPGLRHDEDIVTTEQLEQTPSISSSVRMVMKW